MDFQVISNMNFLAILDLHRYTEELKGLSETFKVTQLPMLRYRWKEQTTMSHLVGALCHGLEAVALHYDYLLS